MNERIYFKHDDGELELRFTVGASRIPGADDGLFAARPYLTNDTLTYYAAAKKSDDLGRVGMPAADAKLERLELPRARYVMEVGGHYIVSYGCNNPVGLANDAGDEHANVTGEGGGRMAATRHIEIGEEIYWCYGRAYWRRWAPRLALPTAGGSAADAGGAGHGNGQGGSGTAGGTSGTVGSGGGNIGAGEDVATDAQDTP